MIIDKLDSAGIYSGLGERIAKGLDYLASIDATSIEPGKYEIDGDAVFAIVMDYQTKDINEGFWEAHRKYIDIQYIAAGSELIGYANIDGLKAVADYDEESDFLKLEGDGSMIGVDAGTFVIFWPHDAHMPSVAIDKPASVRKVVVKVAVD